MQYFAFIGFLRQTDQTEDKGTMKEKSLSRNLFQKLSKTCIKYCEDKLTEILEVIVSPLDQNKV